MEELISQIRESRFSIRKIARAAGLAPSTVLAIREGGSNPTMQTIEKLKRGLDLLSGNDLPKDGQQDG